jgi:hypothetical protein
MFVLVDPLMAYYQELPADDVANLDGISNIRWEERIKQFWAHMYTDMSCPVLELGCGNTSVALHISTVLAPGQQHIIVTDDTQRRNALLHNKRAASATFHIRKKAPFDTSPGPGTLIVHYDGQGMIQDYVHLLANPSSVHVFILESTKELYNTLSPILTAYGWERVKRYIHLSVWCRKKNDNTNARILESKTT